LFFCGIVCKKKLYIFAAMTNQQLVDHGNQMMDETDQAIERGKKVSLCYVTCFFSSCNLCTLQF